MGEGSHSTRSGRPSARFTIDASDVLPLPSDERGPGCCLVFERFRQSKKEVRTTEANEGLSESRSGGRDISDEIVDPIRRFADFEGSSSRQSQARESLLLRVGNEL